MEFLVNFTTCGLIVLAWILIDWHNEKRCNKRHAEMIEAQKDIAETVGVFIADAIKAGMNDTDK